MNTVNIKNIPSITINDVAKSAGVSVGTVSRVLNRAANVAPENQEKVQRAVEQLGYRKHHSAGLLALKRKGISSRSGNIGMVYADAGMEWANHPLNMAYTAGVERACEENGYHPLVEFASSPNELPRCVRERKVDGVLIKATRGVPSFVKDIPAELPMVLVGLNDPGTHLPQASLDNYGAGWMVAKYLWDRGHRRISFLCAHEEHPMFIERMHGVIAFLRSMSAYDPGLFVAKPKNKAHADNSPSEPEESPPEMTQAFDQMMAQAGNEPPSALVLANDWMARGIYDTLALRGFSVPKDISVVGFDNVGMLCSSMTPALTSFDLNFSAVVRAAAMDLFEAIRSPQVERDTSVRLVRGRLIDRKSVADID